MKFITLKEALILRKHMTKEEYQFTKEIADVYCCQPQEENKEAFYTFVANVFRVGYVVGKREERYKNKHGKRALKAFLRL